MMRRALLRVGAHLHMKRERRREFNRCVKAAKTRPLEETRSVAIHEAGHAVAQIALALDFVAVSIIPNVRRRIEGRVFSAQDDLAADLRRHPRKTVYLRHAMVFYGGAEAVRQLIPKHPNPDAGAGGDRQNAGRLIRQQIGGDAESIAMLLSLARRRCAWLVEHYQPEIEALADALEANLILSAKAARKVFVKSLRKRAGRLLIFKSDPTLNGLADDEAFRAFRQKLRLPS